MALAALLLLVPILLAACGDDDADTAAGLSREEVQEIVRSELGSVSAPGSMGLTRAEAEEPVQAAIAIMPTPEASLTQADVEAAIQVTMTPMPQAEPGLTAADVEAAIRAAIAVMPQPEPGLTSAKVEELIQAAITGLPEPEAGLTADEARRLAQYAVATVPPKSAPAEYTKFFVNNAISRYETEGLEATLAHYNQVESIDDQWYVFIVDEDGVVISHFNAHVLGENLNDPLGTDANGYNFGPGMLTATEDGAWVSYVYNNPASDNAGDDHLGAVQLKNAWVVRHDGLLFGSGWYVIADEFTKSLVSAAVNKFRSAGLEATIAYFTGPESVYSGLAATIEYYNSAETVEGEWFAFIADSSGTIVDHYDKAQVGMALNDLLGTDVFDKFEFPEEGHWVTTESVRVWVVSYDGMTFGSGWRNNEPGG